MRIGKPLRSARGWTKADASTDGEPQHVSAATQVGRVNPDVIASVYAPYITRVAEESLEQYAHERMIYDEIMRDVENVSRAAEVDPDNLIRWDDAGQHPLPPSKPLFHSRFAVDEARSVCKEASDHFFGRSGGYRVHLNAAKFERLLDEKYGRWRPFITAHPEVEKFLRSVQRKYAAGHFSPTRRGEPPLPRSTAVIVLFMMQRGKMRWEVMLLATLFFLIGLQPWALVGLVALLQTLRSRRQRKAHPPMPVPMPAVPPFYENAADKDAKLQQAVGKPIDDDNSVLDASDYDVLILGSGPSSLYTGALLARAGRRVLVLSDRTDASGVVRMQNNQYHSIPFDIENNNVPKISGMQHVLAPALATTTDAQGGVRFAQIGTEHDGHAFEVLGIFGVGADSYDQEVPFVLRADGGLDTLMDDAALSLGDGWPSADGGSGNSATGTFVRVCEAMNLTADQYYKSKILPEQWHNVRGTGQYQECSVRYAQSFLDQSFPLNPHTRSLLAGIGMKGENIRPKAASMAPYVTNICASLSTGEGMHYPVGGPRALGHALANVIERNGGRVVTHANIAELVFGREPEVTAAAKKKKDGEGEENAGPCPRCLGVKLKDGRTIAFDESRFEKSKESKTAVQPAVISMEGFMRTFIEWLPNEVRTKYKVPRGLPALTSRRPVFKILLCLQGTAEDLDLTGADYYRLPNAALALDEMDPQTNTVRYGEIGWPDTTTNTTSTAEVEAGETKEDVEADTIVDDNGGDGRRSKRSVSTPKKMIYHPGSSWLHISFPSAKDPSFEGRHGKLTTCVITLEADDNFATFFDAQPKLYSINSKPSPADIEHLMTRIRKDLFAIYPQLEGKVAHAEVVGPLRRGLSHNPERYAAKGIRSDTPYPGLFMGGDDLTVGESFSGGIVGGWLAANAVAGYSPIDHLFLQKNITSDIQQFLDPPFLDEEDDDDDDEDEDEQKKDKDV